MAMSLSQICLPHPVFGQKLPARLEHIPVISHFESGLRVDGPDDVENHFHDEGRQSERGLVHHEELRFRHQGAPDGKHLLFPAGKRPSLLPHPLPEPREKGEHLFLIGRHSRFVVPRVGAEHD